MRQYVFTAIVVAVAVLLVADMVNDAIKHPMEQLRSAIVTVAR